MSRFATVEQFKAHLGALRLSGMAQVAELEEDAFYDSALLAAQARMESAFARAGYEVPLDLESVSSEAQREKLEALLALRCTTFAAWEMLAGVAGAPDGLKLSHDNALKWLDGILSGKETLLGLEKVNQARVVAGRVGVVLGGDDLDRLDRDIRAFGRQGAYR